MRDASQKIKTLSFVAIIAVILGHSPLGASPFASFVESLCISWPVPWFLLVSGYFLRHTFKKYSLFEVLKKKSKTLLTPYCLWCVVSGLILGDTLSAESFGLKSGFPCSNKHLWYLHALICLMMSACLMRFVVSLIQQRMMRIFAVVTLVILLKVVDVKVVNLYGHTSTAIWFVGGYMIAASESLPVCLRMRERVERVSVAMTIMFGILIMSMRILWHFLPSSEVGDIAIRIVWPLGAIVFLWFMVGHIRENVLILKMSQFVFFVYCFHGIPLFFVGNIWIQKFGLGVMSLEIGFVVRAFSVLALSFMLAIVLRLCAPRAYYLFSGGR